jgi:aspartate dehydrogenase
MLKIGVIGCGTIGGEICRAIDNGLVNGDLVGVMDIDSAKAKEFAKSLKKRPPVLGQTDLIKACDLVVEAASKAAAPGIIREALALSKDIMVMSVGGLLECVDEVVEVAKSKGKQIYAPSGAIAGLDAVKASVVASVSKVTLTSRTRPGALEAAPYVKEKKIDVHGLKEATQIFSGSAAEAVPAFPANINVAAALSLAGIGAKKTEVRIIADPGCQKNSHQVEVEGDFGKLTTRTENVLAPFSPMTSYLAALSGIALLRRITSPLVVGT